MENNIISEKDINDYIAQVESCISDCQIPQDLDKERLKKYILSAILQTHTIFNKVVPNLFIKIFLKDTLSRLKSNKLKNGEYKASFYSKEQFPSPNIVAAIYRAGISQDLKLPDGTNYEYTEL